VSRHCGEERKRRGGGESGAQRGRGIRSGVKITMREKTPETTSFSIEKLES
jgi:hypothetical protein